MTDKEKEEYYKEVMKDIEQKKEQFRERKRINQRRRYWRMTPEERRAILAVIAAQLPDMFEAGGPSEVASFGRDA